MLAQFAKKSGYSPVVIDCFSDTDTQALVQECIKVDSLALEFLRPAVLFLQNKYQLSHVVYGSGLECHMDSLAFLQKQLCILGNELDTFTAIQNKEAFFLNLERFGILHPEISFHSPAFTNGWLIKPMQGEGGLGIKKAREGVEKLDTFYYQRYIVGTPMSVLFIANGFQANIYGFQKLWVTAVGDNEFIFSGLINQLEINNELKNQIGQWITVLVKEFSLKGINSLDFILNNDGCFVLELNARPSASMQLYQNDLFSEHINSVLSATIEPTSTADSFHGFKIIFAETDIVIDENIRWPFEVTDIPEAGSIIYTGLPICSIIARGKSERHVLDQIQSKQQLIKKLL